METTKFIRNVQEQNKENYFHNKSRFINTINQITNLSIPLDKNIIDVEYIAKKNNCLTEILQLEEKMDYHRNTDYLKGTIFPVLENYEYTNNIENVLKQMESACIDKTNITFDKNEYYFKFTGTYGQITVFPLSKYLERNFSLQKRSNNKFCIDSAIFYSLQYDWKIGITLLDGKWNDDVYIHCYNYNQSNDLVIDDLGAEKGIVMPREDYLKILKTNDSKETYFTTIERNEVINDYISREPKLLKYKIPN